jgi:hypothetical protein
MKAIERFKDWCRKSNGENSSRDSSSTVDCSDIQKTSSTGCPSIVGQGQSQHSHLQNNIIQQSQQHATSASQTQPPSKPKVLLDRGGLQSEPVTSMHCAWDCCLMHTMPMLDVMG